MYASRLCHKMVFLLRSNLEWHKIAMNTSSKRAPGLPVEEVKEIVPGEGETLLKETASVCSDPRPRLLQKLAQMPCYSRHRQHQNFSECCWLLEVISLLLILWHTVHRTPVRCVQDPLRILQEHLPNRCDPGRRICWPVNICCGFRRSRWNAHHRCVDQDQW